MLRRFLLSRVRFRDSGDETCFTDAPSSRCSYSLSRVQRHSPQFGTLGRHIFHNGTRAKCVCTCTWSLDLLLDRHAPSIVRNYGLLRGEKELRLSSVGETFKHGEVIRGYAKEFDHRMVLGVNEDGFYTVAWASFLKERWRSG